MLNDLAEAMKALDGKKFGDPLATFFHVDGDFCQEPRVRQCSSLDYGTVESKGGKFK